MTDGAPFSRHQPVVLVLAGHDPTGGAGLVADAEAIAACGGWALTIPTALTVQNCRDVSAVIPGDPAAMRAMAAALDEFEIMAIKVGLVADLTTLDAVTDIVRRFPGVPLVVDPVLRAGGGSELSTIELVDAFRARLMPLVDILTPNRHELHRLSPPGQEDTERAVELMTLGCQAVLVTGTDTPMANVPSD
ncbi:MAG: bifunctional hydroxymethylpyrimidine kinase/phosphomethylpyrimidine kinase, partial [Halomonas sp.]